MKHAEMPDNIPHPCRTPRTQDGDHMWNENVFWKIIKDSPAAFPQMLLPSEGKEGNTKLKTR